MFSSLIRENDDVTLNGRVRIGFVVNNDDSKHPDGRRLQRIQVRYPELHDGVEDADLPWQTPGALDAYSGGTDVGSHGPVPPVGARVYGRFEDDSQYHGQYLGGVAHVNNQLAEFTGQAKGSDGGGDQDDASTSGNDAEDQATDLHQRQSYDFAKNYPAPYGSVNQSGDFYGHDPVTDYTEHTAVSGTGWRRDGRGNLAMVVNGNVERQGNDKASSLLPEGFSAVMFGNGTVYLSKDMTLSVKGNATINCEGNAVLSAKGDASVVANGKAVVSAKGDAEMISGGTSKISGKKVVLAGSTIELAGQVIGSMPTGSSAASATSPQDAPDVQSQSAPMPRTRPKSEAPMNDTSY